MNASPVWGRITALARSCGGGIVEGRAGQAGHGGDQAGMVAGHSIRHESAVAVSHEVDPLRVGIELIGNLVHEVPQILRIIDGASKEVATRVRGVPETVSAAVHASIGVGIEKAEFVDHIEEAEVGLDGVARIPVTVQENHQRRRDLRVIRGGQKHLDRAPAQVDEDRAALWRLLRLPRSLRRHGEFHDRELAQGHYRPAHGKQDGEGRREHGNPFVGARSGAGNLRRDRSLRDPLGLTYAEQDALVAFMKSADRSGDSLGSVPLDGSGAGSQRTGAGVWPRSRAVRVGNFYGWTVDGGDPLAAACAWTRDLRFRGPRSRSRQGAKIPRSESGVAFDRPGEMALVGEP